MSRVPIKSSIRVKSIYSLVFERKKVLMSQKYNEKHLHTIYDNLEHINLSFPLFLALIKKKKKVIKIGIEGIIVS